MKTYIAELIYESTAVLGEGSVWDEKNRLLWWVDIVQGCVHKFDPETKQDEIFSIGTPVGALTLDKKGYLILAVKDGFARYTTETGTCEMIAHIIHENKSIRFNDGKCDSRGRFWAGTLAEDGTSGVGKLFCLDTDFSVIEKLSGVGISNGIGWNPEGDTMYYIDSVTQKVLAFRFDEKTGEIATPRTIIEIPQSMGVPDGMCVDAEGMLWIALWDGGKVIRVHPANGEILSEVIVPRVRKVTSCALGGKNLSTLYITTARQGLTPEEIEHEPNAGSLFAIDVEACGLPMNVYRG